MLRLLINYVRTIGWRRPDWFLVRGARCEDDLKLWKLRHIHNRHMQDTPPTSVAAAAGAAV